MKHATDEKQEIFTTIRVHTEFANWIKVEAAKARLTMYEWLEDKVPGSPMKRKGK